MKKSRPLWLLLLLCLPLAADKPPLNLVQSIQAAVVQSWKAGADNVLDDLIANFKAAPSNLVYRREDLIKILIERKKRAAGVAETMRKLDEAER